VIPPTLSLYPPSVGPLPFGSFTFNPSSTTFYNTFDALVRGADWTLLYSFAAVGGAAAIGLALGAVGGFFGGAADQAVLRIAESFRSFPPLVFVLVLIIVLNYEFSYAIAGGLPYSPWYPEAVVVIAFLVVLWPGFALSVRARVRQVLAQSFVAYARACGAPRRRVFFRHVLPLCRRTVAIQFFEAAGLVPLYLVGITWLTGLVSVPEWGALVALSASDVQGFLSTCYVGPCVVPWWQLFFPLMALGFFVLSALFIAEGLRRMPEPGLLPVAPSRPVTA